MRIKDQLRITGRCEMILRGPDGRVKEVAVFENDITDIGFDNVIDILTGLGGSALTYVGIGWGAGANTAFAGTQTDLQGASKDRKAATPTTGTKTFTLSATWGPNEPIAGTVGIEEVGSFWGASGANMFSRLVRPILNKLAVDSLNLNYVFTIA